ncbi:protein Bouncer-like [Myripristis murdjan]|uniref:protein Bouncer-like n=1 Tax=Myripristis murdjan TaxID=586833 RepID=UPI0011762912|nr:protein Bouncer-like [Myripristis murdjan]
MKGLIFCVFAIMILTPAQGDEEELAEQLLEKVEHEEEGSLECFRCDLGFWDACYTTKTECNRGEKCYTGRAKAGSLDIKTLGCVKEEECEAVTTVELFSNTTVFVMTKYCCDTPFCNAGHKLPVSLLVYLTGAVWTIWHLTEA